MIFSLFRSKKPLTPLEAGDIIAVKFPIAPPAVKEEVNPMTGETIGSFSGKASESSELRVLYAAVAKVSKKRNIFVKFVSKDKGDDLPVGMEGMIAALKSGKLIEFPTRLLHRDADTFILAPPFSVESRGVPSFKKGIKFELSLPIDYRALSSPYTQRGTLAEFSHDEIGFITNLPIPAGTALKLDFAVPYRQYPVAMKGSVSVSEPLEDQGRKHMTRVALENFNPKDRDDLALYFLLSKQSWKKA